jgi:AAA domain/UvrD-like helicase C-terminal domain
VTKTDGETDGVLRRVYREVTCEVCGEPFKTKRRRNGRPSQYCSGKCRTRAYRARSAPGADELRQAIGEQLTAAAVDMTAVRAALAGLDTPALEQVHRHLTTIARAWDELATAAKLPTDPSTPVSVTLAPVTPAPPNEPPPPVDPPAPVSVTPKPVTTPAPSLGKVAGLTPTAEQADIIAACQSGGNLVIEAGAGTGKTSTLKMAASVMGRRGLYIAFNRAIARDAARSFPKNVSCSTAHSLAFRAVGHAYKARLDGPRLPARQAAELLGISEPLALGERRVDPAQLARLATETVAKFCRTADREITRQHVPEVNGIDGAAAAALADVVHPLAVAAWDDLTKVDGKLRFTHDCYLKMWALTDPKLSADYILFDEAQDADPLIASVVQGQDAQLIAVGDTQQAIYEWRGAVNAIETWPARTRLLLTQSWRFGPAVADEANKWLSLLNARLRLTGAPTLASRLAPLAKPRAVLCRTNAEAMGQAMTTLAGGRRVALVGGGATIAKLARAAADLQDGRTTDHPELFAFTSWAEVQDYVRQDEAGADLAALVRMVDDHGTDAILDATRRLTEERAADVVVSTAHRAKGREWETVRIAGDFRQPKADENGVPGRVPKGEARLAYVAVTRPKGVLDRGGLEWIDDQLAGRSTSRGGGRSFFASDEMEDW